MIPVRGDVVKVRPLEIARERRREQQAMRIQARVADHGSNSAQAADYVRVAGGVDGDEPGAHQRRPGREATMDRTHRDPEKRRQGTSPQVEGGVVPVCLTEDVVDHRLDDRLRLIAQQKLQNADVGSTEADGLRKAAQVPAGPVASRLRHRAFILQSLLQAAQIARGHPFVGVGFRTATARSGPRVCEFGAALSSGNPLGQRRCLFVPMVKARRRIREIHGKQVSFVRGQHRRSLRNSGAAGVRRIDMWISKRRPEDTLAPRHSFMEGT